MAHLARFDIFDTGCADETLAQEARRRTLENAMAALHRALAAKATIEAAVVALDNEMGEWLRRVDEGEPPAGAVDALQARTRDLDGLASALECVVAMLEMAR